jgi:uncharacterized protein YjbI with pentapeptide repeats
MLIGSLLMAFQAMAGGNGLLPKGDGLSPQPSHDYRHCDFSGRSLHRSDLSGSDLRGVNFQNALLPGCKLNQAKLQGADLKWATLEQANFTRADLSGSLLNGSTLEETVFNRAILTGARFVNAHLMSVELSDAIDVPDELKQGDR